jgi:hypothetical protein
MIAACILVMSVGAMLQFALAYCRTLLVAYSKVELSPLTLQVAKLSSESFEPDEFYRVMCLARMAQPNRDDAAEIHSISAYYRLVEFIGYIVAPFSRTARAWIRQELSRCTYFAAVTLDRRLVPTTD